MSRWEQIHRHFPLRALLAGWLYARWLRTRRWLRYLLGGSRRRWCVACPAPDTSAHCGVSARTIEQVHKGGMMEYKILIEKAGSAWRTNFERRQKRSRSKSTRPSVMAGSRKGGVAVGETTATEVPFLMQAMIKRELEAGFLGDRKSHKTRFLGVKEAVHSADITMPGL